jgi:hypothetical protein
MPSSTGYTFVACANCVATASEPVQEPSMSFTRTVPRANNAPTPTKSPRSL